MHSYGYAEPCGYGLTLVSSFDSQQNKYNFYRGKDCIKRFCSDLKELATKIINYEQTEITKQTEEMLMAFAIYIIKYPKKFL